MNKIIEQGFFDVPIIGMLNEGRTSIKQNLTNRYEFYVDTNHDGSEGYHLHVKESGKVDYLFVLHQDGSIRDKHIIEKSGFIFSKTFYITMTSIPQLKKYNFNWTGIPQKYLSFSMNDLG